MKILLYFLSLLIIKGKVINKTLDKPQKDIKIYLYKIIHDDKIRFMDSTLSNNKGEFKFKSDEGVYLLKYRYGKAIFREDPFFISKDTSLLIPVWEITQDPLDIEISRIHMAILSEGKNISVTEVISFKNFTENAFYKPFEIDLPSGMIKFSPFSGIFPDEVHIADSRLLYYFPIIPGKQVISFNYLVPEKFEFKRKLPFKISLFEIFASPDLKIEGYGKGRVEQIGGKKYVRFVIQDIKSGKEILFRVTKSGKIINFKEIFPLLIVLFFIAIFFIVRWKKR